MEMSHDYAQEMPSSAHVRHHEEKGCNVKLSKKARWIAPGQRMDLSPVDHSFQLQVQAISAEKLPFILHDAVVFTTIAPRTDDDDDDNLSHHSNDDLVRSVIERETRALAASMSMEMEEIFRGTSSSSIVFEFENVQLELKHLGRLIVYVKPQSTNVSGNIEDFYVVAEDDGEGHTGKGEEEVQTSAEDRWEKQAWVVQIEAHIDDEMKVQQEVQSSERPSKIDEVKESSCTRRACQSLKPLISQVIYGNDTIAGQLEQRKKSWPNYTLKALYFACAMLFSAYMNLSSSTSIATKILFVVDIVVFFIVDGVLYINLPSWGNALVCLSCLLLQVALCLRTVPFNGCYAFAILVMLFLILVVALLQPKFQHSVKKYVLPSFTTGDGDTQEDIGEQENHYLNHLFDISNSIATCGGLVTGIMGNSYMVGPVTAAGFFFFCTVLLGLYLMMVIAMRAVSPPHAVCLAIVLKGLLLFTIITASISFVHHSVTNPQVVK